MKRFEFAIAILLTIVLIAAHLVFFFHAGPLWRDEISSLALATKPTLSEFWQSLRFDPFPVGYFLLLRVGNAVGLGHGDFQLRALGLLVGLGLLAAIWIASYAADKSPPLWPLALFGFNRLVLETGDSLRPYGFGLIWIVLAFGFISRITLGAPKKIIVACALASAVLSVQSNFTNALMLFAIICGAAVVLLKDRAWSRILLVLGIGVVAALSLLPYLPIMKATTEWSNILANENTFMSVVAVARDAIGRAMWIWIAFVLCVIAAALGVPMGRRGERRPLDRDRVVFPAILLVLAFAGTVGFLCLAKYLVFPRYFLAVIAIGALCINISWNAITWPTADRAINIILVLAVTVSSLRPLFARAQMRMTNCDQIAGTLEQWAAPDDLIIMTSPLYGISFQRYYHGAANWVTLPPVEDLTLHRWDLIKQAMTQPDPVPALVGRAQNVLQAGHKVFLVGKLGPAPASEPESLQPAPQSSLGWNMEAYTSQWKSELTYWFEHHALHGTNLPVDEKQLVNPLEQLGLFEISGLRDL